jgi:hypothetical protein
MNRTLKHGAVSSPGARLNQLLTASLRAERTSNLVFVYEDTQTRKWAREIFDCVNPKVRASARTTWWKLSDLREAGVLAVAVSTAMRAEVVVVCTRAAESLPLQFYVWVESWLPHRHPMSGALVALLGVPRPPSPPSGRVREYLRALAQEGRMEFVLEECELPAEPSARPRPASHRKLEIWTTGQ